MATYMITTADSPKGITITGLQSTSSSRTDCVLSLLNKMYIYRIYFHSNFQPVEKFSNSHFKNLKPKLKRKMLNALNKSQKDFSRKMSMPKQRKTRDIKRQKTDNNNLNSCILGLKFKLTPARRKQKNKAEIENSEITAYFNTSYSSQKKSIKKTNTNNHLIGNHIIKMTKFGPKKYRRVASKTRV